MPIDIPYAVNLGGDAQAKLDALADQVRRELPEDFRKGGDAAGKALNDKLSKHIDDVSERLKKMSTSDLIGAFGDAKDIFEKTGTALFGLRQETTDAVVDVADLTEKGAMLGGAFGPWGALLGAAGGAAAGLAIEIKEAREETDKFLGSVLGLETKSKLFAAMLKLQQDEDAKKSKAAADAIAALGGALGGIVDVAGGYGAAIGSIGEGTKGAGRSAREAAKDFEALNRELGEMMRSNMGASLAGMGDANTRRAAIEAEQQGALATHNELMRQAAEFELPFPEASAFNSELENSIVLLGGMRDAADDLGAALLDGIGNTAAEAFGVMFDNISEGEKLFAGMGQSLRKSTSDMLKSLGKELIADGTKNILVGTGTSLLGLPNGPALIALGGTEIASGAAMGATGGFLGKGMGGKGAAGGGGDSLARDMAREEQMQRLSTMFYNPRTGEFYTGNDPEARFDPVHSQGTSSRSRRGSSGGAIDAGPPIRGVDPGTRGGGDGGGGTSITVNVDASGALFAEGGPEKLGNTIAMTINKAMFDGQGQAVTMAVAIGGVEALPRLGVGSVLY
jgi:hypothetical protein